MPSSFRSHAPLACVAAPTDGGLNARTLCIATSVHCLSLMPSPGGHALTLGLVIRAFFPIVNFNMIDTAIMHMFEFEHVDGV